MLLTSVLDSLTVLDILENAGKKELVLSIFGWLFFFVRFSSGCVGS